MKILGFRMRSGEDVIAEVLEENEGFYKVKRPVVPMNVPTVDPNTGQHVNDNVGIRLLKLMPFAATEEFEFTTNDYYYQPYEVWKELEDYYIEATSSIKIARPNQKPLVNG